MGEFITGNESVAKLRTALSFTVSNRTGILQECLKIFADHEVDLATIESRPSRSSAQSYDFFVELDNTKVPEQVQIHKLIEELKSKTDSVNWHGENAKAELPWYPSKMSDLDLFQKKTLAYGEDLDADHPGFTDESYRKRRLEIVNNAKNYKFGDPLPRVAYTEEENKTWGIVYSELRKLFPTHACKQFNHVIPLLEQNCGYGPEKIPQLEDVSRFLQQCTGWRLKPVAGLLSPRDFLNGLAFRVFHSTQYIRHSSKPLYTPEPDVCHELIGHVPLLADQEFAAFSQQIGLASLGASDEDIEKLATCYWFTVEFGLCREDGELKAFGAGLLSSFGELEYCLSGKPETKRFDPTVTGVTDYPITQYQPLYYVADSFETAKEQLISFSHSDLSRPFDVIYEPYTQTIQTIDTKDKVMRLINKVNGDLKVLSSALGRFDF